MHFFDFVTKYYSAQKHIIIPQVYNMETIHKTYSLVSGENVVAAILKINHKKG